MKTKSFILLLIIAISVVGYITTEVNEREREKPLVFNEFEKLDAGMMKCTKAEFLLDDVDMTRPIAPLFKNLGELQFRVTTKDRRAQAFFNQGMRLTYAFNHAEAHRSFMEAARLDESMAMAHWGQAFTLGPNINDPLPDDERKEKAYQALQKAKELADKAGPKEQAMIAALSKRYSHDLAADIEELNKAYFNSMKELVSKYPEDADIQTLFAAAAMNTRPWNYWDNEGNAYPTTLQGKAALEKAIALNPDHPGAHHYYIHMVELPKPDLAVPSAEKLGDLMPAAGHIVHMPSHIFIRVGRYKEAMEANIRAIEADEDYISQCYSQGLYPLGYYPHNIHFLWSSASLLGDSEVAIDAAKKTAEKVPVGELAEMPFLQDFASTPMLAYTRFGKWNQILTIPYPGKDLKHLALIWHYSRGIAFLRKNNVKEAQEELEALQKMKEDPTLEELIANYTNPSSSIVKVAVEVLAGEIAAAKGDLDGAIAHLKKGIVYEDELIYSEPAAWHIPVRQTLGSVLMKAEKATEAEQIYREDLQNIRHNGWGLMGLYRSLRAQGKTDEAKKAKEEFAKVWEHADIEIEDSVL